MHTFNTKFSSTNKGLEKRRSMISRKYIGLYGIHAVSASSSDKKIKVSVHSITKIPTSVQKKLAHMAGKFTLSIVEKKIKNPEDFHMEEIFESNKE